MDDDLPMDTSQDVFYFTEGALAYAGYYLHAEDNLASGHGEEISSVRKEGAPAGWGA